MNIKKLASLLGSKPGGTRKIPKRHFDDILPPMEPGVGTDSGKIIHGVAYPDCPNCGRTMFNDNRGCVCGYDPDRAPETKILVEKTPDGNGVKSISYRTPVPETKNSLAYQKGPVLDFLKAYVRYLHLKSVKWEDDGYYRLQVPKSLFDFIVSSKDVQEILDIVPELKSIDDIKLYGIKITWINS